MATPRTVPPCCLTPAGRVLVRARSTPTNTGTGTPALPRACGDQRLGPGDVAAPYSPIWMIGEARPVDASNGQAAGHRNGTRDQQGSVGARQLGHELSKSGSETTSTVTSSPVVSSIRVRPPSGASRHTVALSKQSSELESSATARTSTEESP